MGTIEFRICDVPAGLPVTLGIVALVRTLVVAAQRLRRGDLRRFWVAPENKWLASRYGLGAQCILAPGGKRQPLARGLAELPDRLAPVSQELGDAPFLAALRPIEQLESGADRQRRLYRETGNWKVVIDDMKQRLAQDLEGPAPAAAP
jgi:carboxylate-amine ligase